jgi:predicted alpha/beta-fold hydrolase
MLFKQINSSELPTVILLHGGGLSDWSLSGVAELLKSDYNVVTPIINGHCEICGNDFVSIEDSAEKFIEYVEKYHNGAVFAIGGFSLGAQIVAEVLSQRGNIAQYAIMESVLVLPMKMPVLLITSVYKLTYNLIKKKWFSKLQAKSSFISDNMFEQYYTDTMKLSKQSLINIMLSNTSYRLKDSITNTKAKTMIIAREKEISGDSSKQTAEQQSILRPKNGAWRVHSGKSARIRKITNRIFHMNYIIFRCVG